jgi:hypothetical protein
MPLLGVFALGINSYVLLLDFRFTKYVWFQEVTIILSRPPHLANVPAFASAKSLYRGKSGHKPTANDVPFQNFG